MNKQQKIDFIVKKHGLLREIKFNSGWSGKKPGDYWVSEIGGLVRIDFAPIDGDGRISYFDSL